MTDGSVDVGVLPAPSFDGGSHLGARIRAKQSELSNAGAMTLREAWVDDRLDHLVMLDPKGNEFCIV